MTGNFKFIMLNLNQETEMIISLDQEKGLIINFLLGSRREVMVNKTVLPPINWRGRLLDSNQRPVTFGGRKLSSASHQGSNSWRPNYTHTHTHILHEAKLQYWENGGHSN